MNHKTALIIFVRKPELGKVKTRLAAQVGDEKALEIYKKLLAHTISIAKKSNAEIFIFSTDISDDNWNGFNLEKQIDGNLGEKMSNAFQTLFENKYSEVIIIGSDCPALTEVHINKAAELLDSSDLVIGPAKDGGYYLLGMKNYHPEIFENKNWSTSTILKETIDSAVSLGLKYNLLEELTDVDQKEDLPAEWL